MAVDGTSRCTCGQSSNNNFSDSLTKTSWYEDQWQKSLLEVWFVNPWKVASWGQKHFFELWGGVLENLDNSSLSTLGNEKSSLVGQISMATQ